jgi:quercetin dioxygenase-like cupin family protein
MRMAKPMLATAILAYCAAVVLCAVRVLGYGDNDWLLPLIALTLPWSLVSVVFLWSLIHGASPGFFGLLYLAGGAANAFLLYRYLPRRLPMQPLFSASPEARPVVAVEGVPTSGTLFVRPMLSGEHIAMLEIRMAKGASSRGHAHGHESLLYVISGSLRTTIGDQVVVVRQGQACRHPQNVVHSVEALEDSVFLEVKSPPPELQATLGLST